MAGKRDSKHDFYLNTETFKETASLYKDLAKKMENIKKDMDEMKSNLLFTWEGEGRNMFEKKYRLLRQQFGDVSDDLREMAEDIYDMEQEYIQADTDMAKQLEGSTARY